MADKRSIAPSTTRILQGVRRSLDLLAADITDPAQLHILAAADVALNELMLREDGAYYADFYGAMHAEVGKAFAAAVSQSVDGAVALQRDFKTLPAAISPEAGFTAQGRDINALLSIAEKLTGVMQNAASADLVGPMDRLIEIERQMYDRMTSQAPRPASNEAVRGVPDQQALEAYLKAHWRDAEQLKVTALKRLQGGFQKATFLFQTHDPKNGPRDFVMRADKDEERFLRLSAGDIADEYPIVRKAFDLGLPLAEPVWFEPDPSKLIRRFIVSKRAQGISIGSAVETRHSISEAALKSFATTLAAIHAAPKAEFGDTILSRWLALPTLADTTRAEIEGWRNQIFMGSANHSSAVGRIFAWLLQNIPDDGSPPRLLHTDYGPHNIIIDQDTVTAVLDWEAPRIGDPAEDVSYFIQCTAAQADPRQFRAFYEAAAGYKISEYRLRYFDVFNLLKILIGSMSASAMMDKRPNAGIEWSLLAFKYMSHVAGSINEKIALAEAARER